jgi:hypothetical protein
MDSLKHEPKNNDKTNSSSRKNYTLIIILIIAQISLGIYSINSSIKCKTKIDERINHFIKSELEEKRYKRQVEDILNRTDELDLTTIDKVFNFKLFFT